MLINAVSSIFSLLWLIFVIWMIIDCIRTQAPIFWVFIILFFPPGAVAYFIIYKLPDFELARRWDALWAGHRRISEIKGRLHHMDLPYDWVRLGNEYRTRRNWDEAAHCYEQALERDPNMEEGRYGLGLARLEQQRYDEALELLLPLAGDNPRYEFGAGTLAIARACRAKGDLERARYYYEQVLAQYTYSEARYEYAEVLYDSGEREQARDLMEQIIADARSTTGFSRARERRWARRAALFLKMRR